MTNLYTRAFAAAALLATCAQGKNILINFEDLPASNDNGCGENSVTAAVAFHGLAISNSFGTVPVPILNATKTARCLENAFGLFDQPRATSGANVAVGRNGVMDFEIISGNVMLTNDASFDISLEFTAEELAKKGNFITISTEQADFASVDVIQQFTFHTETDGFGPYHITATNTAKYVFLEIAASVGIPGQASFRHPTIFVDNVQLETAN